MRLTFRKFFVMNRFLPFDLPVFGLEPGIHRYQFELEDDFFAGFDASPIEKGKYVVALELDRRDNEFLLDFDIQGSFIGPCDRCLAEIDVPSSIRKMIWVKYGQNPGDGREDEDLLYIEERQHIFNVAGLIHELIILSMPLVNRYDCENDPDPKCDFRVLEYLRQVSAEPETGENGTEDIL